MTSKRENVLQTVEALVRAALPLADFTRNRDKSQSISSAGDVIMRDGDPGEPVDIALSPLTYWYDHHIPFQIGVKPGDAASQDLDAMLAAIGQAIAANRTLGGLCDFLDATAPETDPLAVDGARAGRWADFDIIATYATNNPLA